MIPMMVQLVVILRVPAQNPGGSESINIIIRLSLRARAMRCGHARPKYKDQIDAK